eukprot:10784374-Alexandrium_andersonii.AAC.1
MSASLVGSEMCIRDRLITFTSVEAQAVDMRMKMWAFWEFSETQWSVSRGLARHEGVVKVLPVMQRVAMPPRSAASHGLRWGSADPEQVLAILKVDT